MPTTDRLTAIVLTQDCQDLLPACLESLGFADRILVVDSGSHDQTREVAATHGATVLEHPLARFDEQRNWAQAQAETPWVVFVDSDERVPVELGREIRQALEDTRSGHVAYAFPRRNFFLGRPIRHCGWGDDRVTRLLRPELVVWTGEVHEKPQVEGTVGTLHTSLLHHTYPTIAAYWDKMVLYTRLKAAQDHERGKRSGFLRLSLHAKAVFLRMYVLQGGWREGLHGLVLCMLSAFSVFTRALRLWESQLGEAALSLPPEGPPVKAPHQGGPQVSVLVPTYNESLNIEGVLDSVGWADEVLVVDSFSTDGTLEVARRRATRVLEREEISSAAQQKWPLPQTEFPWAMVVDADERVTPELALEVRRVLASGRPEQGFVLRRVNHFHGHRIRHCGWNHDRVLRLFNRDHYQESEVDAEIDADGAIATLKHPLLKFTFRSVDDYWPKFRRETDREAARAYAEGREATLFHIVAHPVGRFIKMYLLRLGLLDGTRGLVICLLSFFSVFNKYAKLWEKNFHACQAAETAKAERTRA